MEDIKLYDYQEEMLRRIDRAFETYRSVMVQMPTGTGKTIVIAEAIRSEERRVESEKSSSKVNGGHIPPKTCVWIVAHRRELVAQIENTLESEKRRVRSENFDGELGEEVRIMSIQWLSRHYRELDERPTLIVIDEAHHAVAKTYAEVMNAYPEARKLGVTATPCRMTRRGFADMFDVLLQSWSNRRFIAEGRLSLYDYMSVRADSDDQRIVYGLQKRGADGDFSLKEMSEKLDVRPSIERLCDTVLRYAKGKKGIVYAIDIRHAEHIAEEYRKHGIAAVAISSKTPAEERTAIIERFRNTDCHDAVSENGITVLVNVDLFGEGFDCPDVEFIQLARPTLSLAKYLQQVGRGMRVFEGKKYCLILDNVGLYRMFGLPSDDRDWQAMFEGRVAGKGQIRSADERLYAAYSVRTDSMEVVTADERTELITVMTHDGQRSDLEAAYGYRTVCNAEGLVGVADRRGREVLPCQYSKVELEPYGIAKLHSRRKADRERPWIDLCNGVRFGSRPKIERHGFLSFSTSDGLRLYPRVATRRMSEADYVTRGTLECGIADGLRFGSRYIACSDMPQLYVLKDRMDSLSLYEDEDGGCWTMDGQNAELHPAKAEEWHREKVEWERMVADFDRRAEECRGMRLFRHPLEASVSHGYRLADYDEPQDIRISRNGKKAYNTFVRDTALGRWKPTGSFTEISRPAYGMRVVRNWEGQYMLRTQFFGRFGDGEDPKYDFAELLDDAYLYVKESGREYYVDLESKMCFSHKPDMVKIGFVRFQKDGDMYFPFDNRVSGRMPYRRGEIVAGNGICFIGKDVVLLDGLPSAYYIRRRCGDGKRFVVGTSRNAKDREILYVLYYDGKNPAVIKQR